MVSAALTNDAEYDGVFPWVARTLEGLFRLAGEFELADRIRTSARRVTRRQAAEAEEKEPEESASEDSATEEASASEAAETSASTSDS